MRLVHREVGWDWVDSKWHKLLMRVEWVRVRGKKDEGRRI
jgi:hypothetical protein